MKTKRLLSRAVAVAAVLTCVLGVRAADTYDFVYQNIQYVITSSTTVKVVGPNSTPYGSWNIPSIANGYYVTAIDDYAFKDCTNLNFMDISGVQSIGRGAFSGCTGLTRVTFPTKLVAIKEDAFSYCSALESLTLPGSLLTIEAGAFVGCSSLPLVEIPSSVIYVGGAAFAYCSSLTTLVIGENCRFSTSNSMAMNIFRGCTNLNTITSLNPVAQVFHETVFEQTTYDNAILNVPSSSIQAYETTNYWNKFAHIQGIDVVSLDDALNVPGGNIDFTCFGGYPWTAQTHNGRVCAMSGNQGVSSSTSALTATVTVDEPSIISFDFMAWGEGSNYDVCTFAIDDVVVMRYGAYQNEEWETFMKEIPAGTHTFTWKYTKDSSVSPPGDYFAIDNVAISDNLNPALNVPGGNIQFLSISEYPWIAVRDGDRLYAKSSNTGVNSSVSSLSAVITVDKPTPFSFEFKAWGEGVSTLYDKCIFSINGEARFTYGAHQNDSWETYSTVLPAGTYTMMWSYSKDSSVTPAGDYFAIDNVRLGDTVMRGDANLDGEVSIADVNTIVDYLLGVNYGCNLEAADCDLDGSVGVADVSALIDYLLSDSWR